MADDMDGGFGFTDLGTDAPRVITMKITGKLDANVATELEERLEAASATGRHSRISIELVTFEGAELAVVREKLGHICTLLDDIEHDGYWAWMSKVIGYIDEGTPLYVSTFGCDQDEEERDWRTSGE